MAGKYKEISDQTRQNFIDAFWSLYEKKDINKIKIQEICDIAGYHRNTFYYYFKDVYDVLDKIENIIIEDIAENWGESEGSADFVFSPEKIAGILEKYNKYLKILADEERGNRFSAKMRKVLKNYADDKIVYCEDKQKNDYIHEYHHAGFVALVLYYFKIGRTISIEEVVNIATEIPSEGKWLMRYK